jgi:membrane-bound ClpP family serine protease
MYRGLVASGGILAIFGVFLVALDLYVPMGVSVFGLPIALAGIVMFTMGFFRPEPSPPSPDPGKKFCWYCMAQIPEDSAECPDCSLPQHTSHA